VTKHARAKTNNHEGYEFIMFAKTQYKYLKLLTTFLKRLRCSGLGFFGLLILVFWIMIMLMSLFWTPYGPSDFHPESRLQPPSLKFPFGTDKFGRDVLSKVLAGSKEVITISLSGTLFAMLIGILVGLTSGYFDKLYDEIVMRIMDIFMSFPSLLLALLVLGVLGPGWISVVLVIGVVFTPRVARVTRSAVLEIRHKEFVEAAKSRGERIFYILIIEILPNILGPLGVEFSVRFAFSIFISASLGFLGVGVQPPSPDWGLQVNEGRDFILSAPWVVFFPCLAIASLVVGVNLLSEAIRQIVAGEI
jgi:peptide/nickel transport system permease protein